MGASPSSDACDELFYELCEKTCAVDSRTMASHEISLWCRYRDDILIIYNSWPLFIAYLNRVKSMLRGVWTLECAAVSRQGVDFLDLHVFRASPGDTHVSFKPFTKESNRAMPLTSYSCHPSACFQRPLAHLCRLREHSSTVALFEEARFHFILRLLSGGYDAGVILRAMLAPVPHNPRIYSSVASASFCKVADTTRFVTIVLPFHPALVSVGVSRRVRELNALLHDQLFTVFGEHWQFRVAWKRSAAHLYTTLRRL